MATSNLLYDKDKEDAHKFVPLTDPTAFPSNMLGLHNHIQICNSYTISPANRRDDKGNPKVQCPMYVVLQVTTKYAFYHIVGLIQSYLTEMNIFVKEKVIRTHLAIIGMTANWCPVPLRKTLHKDLGRRVKKLQTSGRVDAKFCHHRVPPILLQKKKTDAQDELS
jgi:hypothetical protein